jgi:hypothetical protein
MAPSLEIQQRPAGNNEQTRVIPRLHYEFSPERSAYLFSLQWSLIHIGIIWIFYIGMTLTFTQTINRRSDDEQSDGLDEATNLDRTNNLDQTAISTNTFGNHIDGQQGYRTNDYDPVFSQSKTEVEITLERFHITEEQTWLQCMLGIIQHQ